MNTYDAAYDLARAIKESDEMKRLRQLLKKSRAMMKQKNGQGIHHGPDESRLCKAGRPEGR